MKQLKYIAGFLIASGILFYFRFDLIQIGHKVISFVSGGRNEHPVQPQSATNLKQVTIPEQLPREDDEAYFGFPGPDCKELLLENGPAHPEKISWLFLHDGNRIPVSHVRTQSPGPEPAVSADSRFFDRLVGEVYLAQGSGLEQNASYLMATEAFLLHRSVLPIEKWKGESMPDAITKSLTAIKGRGIRKSWSLVKLGAEGELYWVWFMEKGSDALASLVWVKNEQVSTWDWPGEVDLNTGTWRVGDGGETSDECIQPIFACLGGSGIELAVVSFGDEGNNILYLIQQGSELRDVPKWNQYRYFLH
jgi:hypothetical protein